MVSKHYIPSIHHILLKYLPFVLPICRTSKNSLQDHWKRLLGTKDTVKTWKMTDELYKHGVETKQEVLKREGLDTASEDTNTECQICVLLITWGKHVLAAGLDYPDVRDLLIEGCCAVLHEVDKRSVLICPGVMDSYAFHLFQVVKKSNMTSKDVCIYFNFCASDDFIPQKSIEKSNVFPSKLTRSENEALARPSSDLHKDSAIKILQITDTHIDHEYSEGSAVDCGLPICCRTYWHGTGSAPKYGTYSCNLPPKTVELMLESVIKQQKYPPDFVIYTGDNPSHAFWNETLEGQIRSSEYVARMLRKTFRNQSVYPIIGNHETHPSNMYYTKLRSTQLLHRKFVEMWKPLANFTEEQVRTLLQAGYYTNRVKPGLRILGINSNFGYTANFYNILAKDELPVQEMKRFMENTLKSAEEQGEKVIILAHHPFGSGGAVIQMSHFINDLCLRYSDTIVLYVGGHTHNDEFRLVRDFKSGVSKLVQLVAPSVTTFKGINPSVRMFYLDPGTFELLTYDQYRLDIPLAEKTGELPPAEIAYSPQKEYGMKDLTPASWHEFVDRMRRDDKLFQKFYGHYYAGSLTGDDAYCDHECKVEILCTMYEPPYDRSRLCIKNNGTDWIFP